MNIPTIARIICDGTPAGTRLVIDGFDFHNVSETIIWEWFVRGDAVASVQSLERLGIPPECLRSTRTPG